MTKQQTIILKGIAILMMMFLHLFNKMGVGYEGLCRPLIYIGDEPLVHLLTNACNLMESIENGFTLYQFYGQMSSQGNYPPIVYQRFMDAVCVLVVTHLLRGNFCYSYTRQILARMLGQGMLPLHGAGRMIGLLKVLSLYPKLLWIASFPHRYIVCKLKR